MAVLRRRFLLVAVGVLVPVALLVWRALASVDVERRERHRVVAERLFDEMERSLATLGADVEAIPFERWPVEATPPDPTRPFIVAYFEIAPDGTLRAPTAARSQVDRDFLRAEKQDVDDRLAQAPGTTRELGESAIEEKALDTTGKSVSAYEALRSLNKGVEQGLARQKRLADERGASAPGSASAAAGLEGRTDVSAPLVGRVIDAQRLLLVRTVLRDGRGYRQGLLLDVGGLSSWLREQAIGQGELRDLATVTIAPGPPGRTATADFRYGHRFAEPFAGLTADLGLRRLPGSGGAGYVYALSALLVVAMTGGLVALYRMVSVALSFAERRSDFVAAVSHELKTPLTSIRMYGEMLRDGIVASEAKRDEYHRHITAESERLSRLINNVLEFARIEKGTRATAAQPGSIATVVDEAVTLLRPHVEHAGFQLHVDVDPAIPAALFERDALLQVLFNLVDNAVKYASDATDRRIGLRARRDGDRVVLSVRDHGPGVPTAQLAHIFEPFFRGERELTRRRKGTGLGLALVRGLSEAMAATVWAGNAVDGGLEVRVSLATSPAP